jgi:hypothetical protein
MNKFYLRSFLFALTIALMPASAESVCGDGFAVDLENKTAIAYPIEKTYKANTDQKGCYGDQRDQAFSLLRSKNDKLVRYSMESIVSENLKLLVTDCAHTELNGMISLTNLTKDNASQVKCNTNAYPSNLVIPMATPTTPKNIPPRRSVCEDGFAVDTKTGTAIAYPINPRRGDSLASKDHSGRTKELYCYDDRDTGIFNFLLSKNPDLVHYGTQRIKTEKPNLTVTDCARNEPNGMITLTNLTKDNADQVACNTKVYPSNLVIPPATSTKPKNIPSCQDLFAVDLKTGTAIAYPINPRRRLTLHRIDPNDKLTWDNWGSTIEPACYDDRDNGIFDFLLSKNPDLALYDTQRIETGKLNLTVTACAEKPDQAPTILTKDNASQVKCNTTAYPSNLVISEGSGSAPATGSPGVGSHSPNTGDGGSED